MHVVKLTLTDAWFDALSSRARTEGSVRSNRTGIQSVVLHAVRPYLSQSGYRTAVLDLNDERYAEYQRAQHGEDHI